MLRLYTRGILIAAFLPIHLHLHVHRFHGPSLDYGGLAAASFASWVGLPGPGESLLIAGGILAAKGKLDLTEVLIVAFLASLLGGIIGWVLGLKAGRALLERPGPLLRFRRRALRRGDEVFQRYPAFAVMMTTSWIAGINRAGTSVFMLWNAVGAALWTLAIGLGAYFAGPPIVDLVGDSSWLAVFGVVGVVLCAVALEIGRRRRRRSEVSAGAGS